MKIDGFYTSTPLPSASPRAARTTRPNQPQAPSGSDAVTVEISAQAERMSSDEPRQDRLAAIREQLAAGTYNISGKDVANKILDALKG